MRCVLLLVCTTLSTTVAYGIFAADPSPTSDACQDIDPNYCATKKILCQNPATFVKMALECAKTCEFCDVCKPAPTTAASTTTALPCVDHEPTCPRFKSKCDQAVVQLNCPVTCDCCGEITTTLSPDQDCADPAVTCCIVTDFCADPNYHDLMVLLCPHSCSRCTESTATPAPGSMTTVPPNGCCDRSAGCSREVNRCHDPLYENIMRKECAKLCGFCTAVEEEKDISELTCVDQWTECDLLAEQCGSADPSIQLHMSLFCAATCGTCADSAVSGQVQE